MTKEETLQMAYRLFNSRKADELLELLTPDVHWPNGWEGGHVEGREAVKQYWLRQWKEIDPEVQPLTIVQCNDGRTEVLVHQKVKDLEGKLLFDGQLKHVYSFADTQVKSMEIIHGESKQSA